MTEDDEDVGGAATNVSFFDYDSDAPYEYESKGLQIYTSPN